MVKVVVLMGGISSEREISLLSGAGVVEALRETDMDVVPYTVTDDIADLVNMLTREKPDVIFNALHGQYGEDGRIQGLLDLMKIPYTHSGVLASAIGMDKETTKQMIQEIEIPVARGGLVSDEEIRAGWGDPMPYVVKPNDEGSSVGVTIVRTKEEEDALLANWPAGQYLLMEEFIPGRELSVAVLDGEPLGIVELVPKTGYYDYNNKYTDGATTHIIPAQIPDDLYRHIMEMASDVHLFLGCRGVTRSDFRLDDVTDPAHPRAVFLEINTNPGMTKLSLVPEIAWVCEGISYRDLVVRLVEEALCDASKRKNP